MTQLSAELPLYADPTYQYNASIEGVSRLFRFKWNDRTKSYQMDVLNEDGTPVLLGQRLVSNYPMFVDYPLSKYNLTGYFVMLPRNTNQLANKIASLEQVSERYSLFYIYEELQ